jgi:heme-degrading monooxygenase HmoA
MYARVITMRLIPGKMDQAIRIFQHSAIPAVQKQKGYVDFSLMENRDMNELIVMSRWETERDMLALEENDFVDQQMAKLSTVVREPPTGACYKLLPTT